MLVPINWIDRDDLRVTLADVIDLFHNRQWGHTVGGVSIRPL